LKINTKVVINMITGEELECESYNYEGPLGECGGKKEKPAPAPAPPPEEQTPTVMPMPDDEEAKKKKKKEIQAQQKKGGRTSTILSSEDKLG